MLLSSDLYSDILVPLLVILYALSIRGGGEENKIIENGEKKDWMKNVLYRYIGIKKKKTHK